MWDTRPFDDGHMSLMINDQIEIREYNKNIQKEARYYEKKTIKIDSANVLVTNALSTI